MALTSNQVDMSVKLSDNFILKNPILTASGTFGYCDEFEDYTDISSLGAVVTKAITREPRTGNDGQRVLEVHGGMINSIGLENIGIEKFIETRLPILKAKNIEFIINIAGASQDEYMQVAEICEANKIKAIELNISCPNVKQGCLEFGTDEKTLFKLISNVRNVYKGCLIVKITPNVTSVEKIALAAQNAGTDCISAINTVKALALKLYYDKNRKQFVKTRQIQGGLSGKAVKPIALGVVSRLSQVLDIPIIGIGGIYSLEDVFEFFAVGADAVQIGTANFTNPDISGSIVNQLQNFMTENDIQSIDELKLMLKGTIK